jgi:hypothetical protein
VEESPNNNIFHRGNNEICQWKKAPVISIFHRGSETCPWKKTPIILFFHRGSEILQ